jgi:hypothetical protein
MALDVRKAGKSAIAYLCLVVVTCIAMLPARIIADEPPPATFSIAQAGSVFHFHRTEKQGKLADPDDWDEVVGQSDGFNVRFARNKRQLRTVLLTESSPDTYTPDDAASYAKIWPLQIGKTVAFKRHLIGGWRNSWSDELSIKGVDEIQIGESKVFTYVVQWKSQADYRTPIVGSLAGEYWKATAFFWFAPSLGWVVKVAYATNFGQRATYQVTTYQLAQP